MKKIGTGTIGLIRFKEKMCGEMLCIYISMAPNFLMKKIGTGTVGLI